MCDDKTVRSPAPERATPEDPTPDRTQGDLGHPAAQIPLSTHLVDRLGDSAEDYAMALWATAQHLHTGPDEMAALIRGVNDEFGVVQPDEIINKWQEIFRNSGGFLTIICQDRVLAGALSDSSALEEPHASNGPVIDQQSDTQVGEG